MALLGLMLFRARLMAWQLSTRVVQLPAVSAGDGLVAACTEMVLIARVRWDGSDRHGDMGWF